MTRLAAREGAGSASIRSRLALAVLPAPRCPPCLAMRDAERALRFQLLIYGCFSTDCDLSWQRFGQAPG